MTFPPASVRRPTQSIYSPLTGRISRLPLSPSQSTRHLRRTSKRSTGRMMNAVVALSLQIAASTAVLRLSISASNGLPESEQWLGSLGASRSRLERRLRSSRSQVRGKAL